MGDRKSLIVYARPRFPLGDGVWGIFPFLSMMLVVRESTTKKPVPIFSVSSAMNVSFSGM